MTSWIHREINKNLLETSWHRKYSFSKCEGRRFSSTIDSLPVLITTDISSRHKGSKHSVYIHSPLRLPTNLFSVAFVDLVIDVKEKHGNCKTWRSLAQISSVYMWTESDFGVCSGARTSERGSIYDPDDLSGRCSPLPAERRKHRHHLKTKVSIQPEQQYCPCEYMDKAHVHNC